MSSSRKPAVKKAAKAGHRRTRADHATELTEDYVEAVESLTKSEGRCRVTDLADRFGVSHVTVTRAVGRLVRDGFARQEPYGPVELTAKGRRLAEASRKRHQTVLKFLLSIGVPEDVAAVDAEGLEHHVSPETLRAFRRVIRSGGL